MPQSFHVRTRGLRRRPPVHRCPYSQCGRSSSTISRVAAGHIGHDPTGCWGSTTWSSAQWISRMGQSTRWMSDFTLAHICLVE